MKTVAIAAVAVVFLARTAAAQSAGAGISGIVTDGSGGRVQDAVVLVVHADSGRAFRTTTGSDGHYRIPSLLPGDYDVSAERSGFTRVVRRITLFVGGETTADLSLAVAGPDVRTTVRPEVPLVDGSQSQPWSAIVRPQLDGLPVLERNFLVLAQLLPGSGPINSTVSRFAVTKFGGVADQRSGYTTLIDGGDVDDAQWGSPTINVGQDAVQEFKVFRSQFDAQYGHALNAVVTVATRSGTNVFSGTGFYFGRDDSLNARNVFATSQPPFEERRLGATAGGPVVRDRSHFFGAYEHDAVDNARIIALPSANFLAATENGIFPAESDDRLATARVDHRATGSQQVSVRYNHEHLQSLRANVAPTSDTVQTDVLNRSHSLIGEHTWNAAPGMANTLRLHALHHSLGTTARNQIVAISRPAGSIGQTSRDSQVLTRTRVTASDSFYVHARRHDLKFGGEATFGSHQLDAHVLEFGLFRFTTDLPFDPAVQSTWPRSFEQQAPTQVTYRSRELALFAQDDWRIASRVRVNAGVRYDIDFNLRINDFTADLLDDPGMAGLDQFISRDRGTDTNNVQPRLGATWDATGSGRVIVRGGAGLYVTRNRPWYQLRAMNQAVSGVVRITDARLRNFPDIAAVLGSCVAGSFSTACGPKQLGTVIPDDFVQPSAVNTTGGVGWQITSTAALDVDYVHSYGAHQVGSTDRNLPQAGLLANTPRPVPAFSQIVMLENFSRSWYDALEAQLRGRIGSVETLQVSYTLSRSYLDGVDFFLAMRGTQRTPHERGYNPSDQRHNLTAAATLALPWDMDLSGIVKLVSGSPVKVQAGVDLDGDDSPAGDLPAGIPTTVGRERVDESLAAINEFRASVRLAPIDRALLALDPYRSLDLRLTKSIRLGSVHRLELLIEAFNVTNAVNFRPPVAGAQPEAGVSINTAAFLQRTSARDARQIQWGARYRF